MLTKRPYILGVTLPAFDLERDGSDGTPLPARLPANARVLVTKHWVRGMVEVVYDGHRYAVQHLDLCTRAILAV